MAQNRNRPDTQAIWRSNHEKSTTGLARRCALPDRLHYPASPLIHVRFNLKPPGNGHCQWDFPLEPTRHRTSLVSGQNCSQSGARYTPPFVIGCFIYVGAYTLAETGSGNVINLSHCSMQIAPTPQKRSGVIPPPETNVGGYCEQLTGLSLDSVGKREVRFLRSTGRNHGGG